MSSAALSPIICLGQTYAHASFDQNNQPIKMGRKKTRFSLCSQAKDPKFSVAGKIIASWNLIDQLYRLISKLLGYHIEVKSEQGQIVLLNINSIASRLHVDKEAIKQAAKEGKAEEYLKEISSAERIEKLFKKINSGIAAGMNANLMQSFNIVNGLLVYKDTNMETGLTPQDLQEGLEEALQEKDETVRPKNQSYKFWRNEEGEPAYLVKKLGEGTFGKAYLFFDLNDPVAGVLKSARLKGSAEVIKEAIPAVKNESALLREAHKKGKAWGIQSKPRRCQEIKIQTKEGKIKERYGFIGCRYDNDYFSHLMNGKNPADDPIESRLVEFHQLLGGLKRLADLNLLHGDIKPENILCKKNGQFQVVHIADIAGGCNANKSVQLSDLIAGDGARVATPSYVCVKDFLKSQRLAKNKQRAQLIENETERDVFSMGIVFYIALTGKNPFPIGNGKLPVVMNTSGKSNYRPIGRADVPEELENIVKSMLVQDSAKRISPAEAFYQYDSFVQSNYPAIYEQIQNEMIGYVC